MNYTCVLLFLCLLKIRLRYLPSFFLFTSLRTRNKDRQPTLSYDQAPFQKATNILRLSNKQHTCKSHWSLSQSVTISYLYPSHVLLLGLKLETYYTFTYRWN